MDESHERRVEARSADRDAAPAAASDCSQAAPPRREGQGAVSIVVVGAVLANVALMIAKYIVAVMSGSSSLLSEAFHSTADTGNSLLLIVGVKLASRPADRLHPFGRGKEVYFWGLMVAIVLFGLGGGLSLYEGVQHVLNPHPLEDPLWSYIVLAIALVCEGSSFALAVHNMRRIARAHGEGFFAAAHSSKNPEHFVVLFEDSAAILGLVVAFVGVYASHQLNAPFVDGVASIIIGVILAAAAFGMAYECRSLLLGEGADPAKVADIRAIVSADSAVVRAAEPLTMYLGPADLLVNLAADFRDELSAGEVEAAVRRLECTIRARHRDVGRIFIEVTSLNRPGRRDEGHTSSESPVRLGARTQRS